MDERKGGGFLKTVLLIIFSPLIILGATMVISMITSMSAESLIKIGAVALVICLIKNMRSKRSSGKTYHHTSGKDWVDF